ncbi:MAG: hypothetical protein LBD06_01515 [Candidatus Accumulibacter sp.]|nr:hypothetical protein [Accumulibacter sp.]
MRGQKTDWLGRFAPSNERKTGRSVFPHSPGAIPEDRFQRIPEDRNSRGQKTD